MSLIIFLEKNSGPFVLLCMHFTHSCLTIKFCMQEGEVEAVGVVHSYEEGLPPGSHKTRLTALNVLNIILILYFIIILRNHFS